MSFCATRKSMLILVAAFAAAGAPSAQAQGARHVPAQTLTIVLDGTLGPVLSGSDPAGLDGDSATVTITASESLKPFKTKGKSASYHIPAGDRTVDVNGTDYTSTSRSTMTVRLGSEADLLAFSASLKIEGFTVSVSDVSSLQAGSWTKSVLKHPGPFSPSPQDLTEPSSNFTYTVFGETTVLGVTGTASNSDAAD
jgi:hypothetical protein